MPAPVHLYNTMTRSVELLQPITPGNLAIYTCGPTVYGQQHIGNYRTFVFEDTLVKALRYLGYQVKWVMNITDVGHLTSDEDEGEDKLEVGARREGITAWQVAAKYEKEFLEDLNHLHITHPDSLVRATSTIAEQISLIQSLETKGYTYQTADGIYFDSSKVGDYGKLARLDVAGLQAGARVAMQEGKRNLTDFALWKFSPLNQKRDMEWESPWGKGFPGWHIECSAIAMKSLGPEIDIHCGGVDHIPVHHTNEIAQSESVTGKTFVRHWCHADFLLVDDGKMGKSLGNLYTLSDLKERGFEPLALRLLYYGASYRSKLNFTWQSLEASQKVLDRLRLHVSELPAANSDQSEIQTEITAFQNALANDLNMPAVAALVLEVLKSSLNPAAKKRFIEEVEQVVSLGLLQLPNETVEIPSEIQHLVEEREGLRQQKKWTEADAVRAKIEMAGFMVIDEENGSRIKKKMV